MDSNKVLIGFFLVAVRVLGFPIVAKKMKASPAPPGTATAAATGGSPQGAAGGVEAEYPELLDPPLLNEQNLVGTEWQVEFEKYKVKVTIGPGGVAYATHPMAKALTGLDYIEGRWRLQYNKLFVNASLGGNEMSMELRIAGMKVYSLNKKGKPSEVKRF